LLFDRTQRTKPYAARTYRAKIQFDSNQEYQLDAIQAGVDTAEHRLRPRFAIGPDYDENAPATLNTLDHERLQFLRKLLKKSGVQPSLCKVYANIFYAALIGLEQLSHRGVINRRRELVRLSELLLRGNWLG